MKGAQPSNINYSFSILDFDTFSQNAEFIITRVHMKARIRKYACCPEGFPVLNYQFTFRRSSLTYISGIILPLIIITMVSHFGMLMGASSGARTGLGITAMLTTSSVYLVASSSVPKTGEWTLVGQMYLFCLINGLVVILVGIVSTSLTLIEQEDALTESHLQDVFRRFDKDGSGELELDEAKNALTELGLEEREQSKCLMKLNHNRDGMIEMEEWLKISNIVAMNRHGHNALAKYHNTLTGWMVRVALEKDKEDQHSVEWQKQVGS